MRITADLVRNASAYINPLQKRELSLRNYNIVKIENLGATDDNYEALDLSDNQIAKLENFPLMKRLQCILLCNNRIFKIDSGLGALLPHLDSLLLTNNKIRNLADLDALAEFTKLTHLSLVKNPVCQKEHYRLYLIHKLPSLLVLDFAKIKPKERAEAKKMFGGIEGKEREESLRAKERGSDPSKTFVPGGEEATPEELAAQHKQLHELIKNATSMKELDKLEQLLASGKLLSKEVMASLTGGADSEDAAGTSSSSAMETDE